MAELRPTVQRIADELVDDLVDAGGGDLIATVAEPLPVAVIAEMLGVPGAGPAPAAAMVGRHLRDVRAEPDPGGRGPRGAGVRGVLGVPARRSPAARRTDPRDDLITALVQVQDEGDRLTEDELIGTCVLLLNAGHEATVNVTGNGWWTLFRHPDQLAALRADPALLPTAVEELMRYDTPLQMFERWVLEDIEVRRRADPARRRGGAALRLGQPRPRGVRRPGRGWTCPGWTTRTCRSARASTSASARRWPGWSWRSRSARCCAGRRSCSCVAEPEWKAGYIIRGLKELRVTV